MKKIFLILICILIVLPITSEDMDVKLMIPEDYGIEFPSGLHLDRLYFAIENPSGDLEILSESDIDLGYAYNTNGVVTIILLYYGNLSEPYSVAIVVDPGDGFKFSDPALGTFTIPITPSFSIPESIEETLSGRIFLNSNENRAELIVNPAGPINGERVANIMLNWTGGRDLLPGSYLAEISMALVSE